MFRSVNTSSSQKVIPPQSATPAQKSQRNRRLWYPCPPGTSGLAAGGAVAKLPLGLEQVVAFRDRGAPRGSGNARNDGRGLVRLERTAAPGQVTPFAVLLHKDICEGAVFLLPFTLTVHLALGVAIVHNRYVSVNDNP